MTQKPVDLEALSALEAKGMPNLEDMKTPITPSPLMAKAGHPATVRARFWSKVEKGASCWNWTGCLDGTKQYGALHKAKAHRVSWELHFGPIPSGQHVLHRCDNGLCVRPEHLFLGTNLDNIIDKTTKGRAAGKKKKRTHCKKGHLFTEENSRYTSGGRRCLRCEAERKIAIRDWRKERAALLAEVASLKSESNAAPAMIEELKGLRAEVEGLKADKDELAKCYRNALDAIAQSRAQLATAHDAIQQTLDLLESSRKAHSKGSPEYDALFIRCEVGGVLEDALKKNKGGGA